MNTKALLLIFLIVLSAPCYTQRAEDYKTLSDDGSWSWFSDPGSEYFKGKFENTYTGFITSLEDGDPKRHNSDDISINHSNPETVYLSGSFSDRSETEEWATKDGGETFISKVKKNNFLKGNEPVEEFSDELSGEAVTKVANAVATWQINNFGSVEHNRRDWTNATLYSGMMEWAKVTDDKKYIDWLYQIGTEESWQPNTRIYLADDIAVSQMYLEMYQQYKDADFAYQILGPTKARLDYVLANPSHADLYYSHKNPQSKERWSWCDALFMAPPVYAKMAKITGDETYLSYMDQEFKASYELLYDTVEHLFYRDHRFFPEKKCEANGEKIFWGRGNGWVMGGLVLLLKDLPEKSEYRLFYEQLFIEMATKIKDCQDENGLWHASMLDLESYPNPETSSSAFFLYAMAFGVNNGLLNKEEFLPLVEKAWKALVRCVYSDGKLGWVQPIGDDPKNVCAEMTEVYGVGAFLLAASEIVKMAN